MEAHGDRYAYRLLLSLAFCVLVFGAGPESAAGGQEQPTVRLISAASRRQHGDAGPFDLPIPLTGGALVEPRQNGDVPQMLLTFDGFVSAIDGSIDCGQEVVVTNGGCIGVGGSEGVLTIDMTFHKNACVAVRLNALAGVADNSRADVLTHEGDVYADMTVNIMDLLHVKNVLRVPVHQGTFWFDVTANGAVDLADLVAVRNNLLVPIGRCAASPCNDPFADADGDGDVDLDDNGHIQVCAFLPVDYWSTQCHCFDRNHTGEIDLDDYEAFNNCYSGPETPADPKCDGEEQ